MARFCGKVGYVTTSKTAPGVWSENRNEVIYYGDVLKNTSAWVNGSNKNDDIRFSNTISIVADPYALANFDHIRYVEWMGHKWEVTNVDVQYPRLVLTIGGIYNATPTNS